MLLEKRIRFTQPCFLNDPFEFKPGAPDPGPDGLGHVEAKAAKKRATIYEENSRLHGVLSLTERNDSIPMWAHYGAAHSGFVIGFDTGSGLFKEAIAERKLGPVIYRRERLILTRSQPNEPIGDRDTTVFMTKSCDWISEKEWRWLERRSPFDYAEVCAATNGELLYLRQIPPETVQEIILGYRIGPALTQSIQALRSTAQYKHVSLFRVALNESLYTLNIEPV